LEAEAQAGWRFGLHNLVPAIPRHKVPCMVRRLGVLLVLGLVVCHQPAPVSAVIKALTPLDFFLDQSSFIVVATIDQFFAEKPALILSVKEDLKGKADYRRLPVVVRIDREAVHENYVPQIMKRLKADQDVILFAMTERNKKTVILGFTNGSWFQMTGDRVDKGRVVWSLVSGEPVLRQTFKGATQELRQLVIDHLAGKRKAPAPDRKEKPGFGPEAARSQAQSSGTMAVRLPRSARGPLFAVIPTLGLGAPLAILALLFPTVFGGVLILFRQWLAFITVLSVNCALYVLSIWLGTHLRGTWWASPAGLWLVMTAVVFLGFIWSWRRQTRRLSLGAGAVAPPRKTEAIVLCTLATLCGGSAIVVAIWSAHFDVADYLLFAFAFGLAVGTGVYFVRGKFFALSVKPGQSTEAVIVSGVLLAHLGIAAAHWKGSDVSGEVEGGTASGRLAELVGLRWKFTAKDHGLFVSSVLIDGNRLYAAAACPGLKVGTLYCLERFSGKKIWQFQGADGSDLKNMISSPCLADGRIFIGEGFHDDPNCKLWCVDAASGSLAWHFQTRGQIESSPTAVAGKVYFGAGNEGLYCLEAMTGKELWRFPGPGYDGRLLRFGAGPTVVGDRVYVGTGIDRNKADADPGETALFCVDAHTGKLIWKAATSLPAWGAPVVSKGQVFLGTGNGDIFDDAKEQSVGAVLCFDAQTGAPVWQYPLGNGVLDRPAVDDTRVYAGCRNGHVYCLDRKKGKRLWKTNLNSPVVAAPALAAGRGQTRNVFAVATGGKVCCLDPQTGAVHWTYNLTSQKPHLSAAPKVIVSRAAEADCRQIYFGAGIGHIVSGRAVLYCLEDKLEAVDGGK
jgi:outer membrane protein assembly factor BamB